ncbi:MAG TPA: 3-methyladenine DNA glycosylase [Opitutaceae bacterium]|nr:3-methyladenine DNA glycosylase [Opitutaceae bacterium]
MDFLFTYYSFKPSQLRLWSPGVAAVLAGSGAESFLARKFFSSDRRGVFADPALLPAARLEGIRWMRNLLRVTFSRTPQFGCFGFHEWAMLYQARPDDIRHTVPLRLSVAEISQVLEANTLCCSHFDAFRHFTSEALERNSKPLRREDSANNEQRGCLHVNMDLYKWSSKLAPFVPSELVADCFELAAEIRGIDMRASPYDLTAFGYSPIPIETREGRDEYVAYQRQFAERGQPLRKRLLDVFDDVLSRANAAQSRPPLSVEASIS